MESWYIEQPQPTLNSGLENDEWDSHVIDCFDEALTETRLGETVKFCKGQFNDQTGLFETEFITQAIVQDKSPDAYTRGWQREILARMADKINEYKYVKYTDIGTGIEQIYLIETMPSSNGIYTKAVIHECNYTLKWQDESGKIRYAPSFTQDCTQYNTGETNVSNVLRTGYTQYMSWLPIDDLTMNIKREQRFFIDFKCENPLVFRVTSTSHIPYSYNEYRMLRVTFTEDIYNPDTDNINLWLCDYRNILDINSQIEYSGGAFVRIGGKKKFSLAESNVVFSLNVPDMFKNLITLEQHENQCVIKCENNISIVGTYVKLVATYSASQSELLVEIKGAV